MLDFVNIPIGELEYDELRGLFVSWSGIQINDDQEYILKELFSQAGYHTLAIELIAKQFNREHVYNLSDKYKELIAEGILSDPVAVQARKDKITSNKSPLEFIGKLFDFSPLSKKERIVLDYASLLPMDGISIALMQRFTGFVQKTIILDLIDLGWLKWVANSVDCVAMHPLLAELVRQKNEMNLSSEILLVEILSYIKELQEKKEWLPVARNTYISVARNLKRSGTNEKFFADYLISVESEYYLPNPVERLEWNKYALTIYQNCNLQEWDLLEVKLKLIESQLIMGDYNESIQMLLEIESTLKNTFVDDLEMYYKYLAIVEHYLGYAYSDIGQNNEAERRYRNAINHLDKMSNPDLRLLSDIRDCLGVMYNYEDRFDEAYNELVASLKLRIQMDGECSPTVAEVYNNLGCLFKNKASLNGQDIKEEEETLLKAIGIMEKLYGNGHAEISYSYLLLSDILCDQNRFTEALKLIDKAISAREAYYGREHRHTADAYSRKGQYFEKLKDVKQAEIWLGLSTDILLKIPGAERSVSDNYFYLGRAYYSAERYSEAKSSIEKSLKIKESSISLPADYVKKAQDLLDDVLKKLR